MLRQLNSCVSTPPSAGPAAAPMLPANPHTAERLRIAATDAGEHGHRAGQRERGAEALQHAADDQDLERRGEAANERRDREHAQADPREDVSAHAPLERQHRDRADDDRDVVGGDGPRHADDRHVEGAVEIREREHHDRRVGDRQRDCERDDGDQQRIVPARRVGGDCSLALVDGGREATPACSP